ncbi:MAG: FlgD immunoglobulin-like domain containing protein, partial [Candidatus Tenebribacter mawsonii]|nr:FlgD immunoglobulin-like domain containing protein [Candidatus Tenebribacter mawsonii]
DLTYPVAISAEGLTLEYGKAYLVLFNEQVDNFYWTDTSITVETEKKSEPENFTYTEKADYEAIDVFNIPPNVTEIGVFEDDVCVGAVVVEDTCAQILVYSDNANRDPIPFNFEIVTGRGFSTPIKDYQVLNLQSGEYETKSIFSGWQEYSIIRFGDEDETENNNLSTPQLYGNYPNPFNPTTTISFSVTQNSDFVTLEIFNIKGQKVKTLYKGIAEEGKHSVIWEGKDTNGKSVSSGIYFYKLKTNSKELTRKMLMLK